MLGKTTPFQQKLLKSLSRSSNSNEKGITLLESLVAIIVITIAISVVTPPIFLAVATRVQNRKAEQAMQLAQKYTDRIRGIVEQGEYSDSQLPNQNTSKNKPSNVAAPSAWFKQDDSEVLDSTATSCSDFSSFDPTSMPAWDEAMKVDVNGDCEPDFFVQIFRSNLASTNSSGTVTAFPMGVRVYAMVAEDNVGSGDDSGLEKPEASLTPTQGFGEQTTHPLAVKYTNVIYSEAQGGDSLDWYKNLVNP